MRKSAEKEGAPVRKAPAKKSAAKKAPTRSDITEQRYEIVPIDSLKAHPRNPRRGNVEVIRQSVDRNGFYGAVYVQASTGRIIAGHHRWASAKAEGMTTIPVIFVNVDDAAAERIVLVDNRSNDLASYDEEVLRTLLQDVSSKDTAALLGTGYIARDVEEMLKATAPPVEFEQFDETIKVHYKCPKCAYEWSAGGKPESRSPALRGGDGSG